MTFPLGVKQVTYLRLETKLTRTCDFDVANPTERRSSACRAVKEIETERWSLKRQKTKA